MTLNPDLVRSRSDEIETSVARLEQLRIMPREHFLTDRDAQDIACYRLLVAIEAALALCYHVSAKRLKVVPDEYAACFGVLGDAGFIPGELAGRLQEMARFRNLLVHMYWKVDYTRVYDLLHERLDDLRAFARAVSTLL